MLQSNETSKIEGQASRNTPQDSTTTLPAASTVTQDDQHSNNITNRISKKVANSSNIHVVCSNNNNASNSNTSQPTNSSPQLGQTGTNSTSFTNNGLQSAPSIFAQPSVNNNTVSDINIDPSTGFAGSFSVINGQTPYLGAAQSFRGFATPVASAIREYDKEYGYDKGTELIHNTLSYYAEKGDLNAVLFVMSKLGGDYLSKYDSNSTDNYEQIGSDYKEAAAALRNTYACSAVKFNKCGPIHEVLANHYRYGGATKAAVVSHDTTEKKGHLTAIAQYKPNEYIHQDYENIDIVKAPTAIEAIKSVNGSSDNLFSSGIEHVYGLSKDSHYKEFVLPSPYKIDKNEKEHVLNLSKIQTLDDLKLSKSDIQILNQLSKQVEDSGLKSSAISCKIVSGKNQNGHVHGAIEEVEVNSYSKNGDKIRIKLSNSGLSNQDFVKVALDIFSSNSALGLKLESGNAHKDGVDPLFNNGYNSDAKQNKITCTAKAGAVGIMVEHDYIKGNVDASTVTKSNLIRESRSDYEAYHTNMACSVDILKGNSLNLTAGTLTSNSLILAKTHTPNSKNSANSDDKQDVDWRIKYGPFVKATATLPTSYDIKMSGKASFQKVGDIVKNNPSEQVSHLKTNGSQVELSGDVSVYNPKNGLGGAVGLTYATIEMPKSFKKQIGEVNIMLNAQNTAGIQGLDTSLRASLGKEDKDLELTACKEPLERIKSKELGASIGYTLPTRSKAWKVEGDIYHRVEENSVTKTKEKETVGGISLNYQF